MIVFYIIFIITLVLSKNIGVSAINKQYLYKLFIVFTPLFIYGAIRVKYGIDYLTYEEDFKHIHNSSEVNPNIHMEIGFQRLMQIMPTWRSIVVLSSLLLCTSWVYLLYNNVDNRNLWFAICLIFVAGNFTIFTPLVAMRNGMAISIMMFSSTLIAKRKYLICLSIAYLAHYLHSSILLFMPLALLIGRNVPISSKEIKIWGVVLIVLFLTSATSLINVITPYIELYFDRYNTVLKTMSEVEHFSYLANAANLVFFTVIMRWFYVNRHKLTDTENSYIRIGLIYLFCSFLGPLGGARMQAYFVPFFILVLVKLYSTRWSNENMKLIFFIFTFLYFLYRFFYVWQWNNPYFVFDKYESLWGVI